MACSAVSWHWGAGTALPFVKGERSNGDMQYSGMKKHRERKGSYCWKIVMLGGGNLDGGEGGPELATVAFWV